MLKLLQSIFARNEHQGRYPESLIEMAIERAVDGTYPRLRALPGYAKRLRDPVIHAIDHVVALVENVPPPITATAAAFRNNPRLEALFASPEHLLETFSNDTAFGDFRNENPVDGNRATALLLAEYQEKNILGVEMVGDMLCRDVAQVSVTFRNQRLIDPAIDPDEVFKLLRRRAFDYLISMALATIVTAKGTRAELTRERELLKSKLVVLQKGGWSFADERREHPAAAGLPGDLDEIEAQLAQLNVDEHSMAGQLELLADLLASAEKQLWIEPLAFSLDRMNIKRPHQHPDARPLNVNVLRDARGQALVTLLVSFDPSEIPRRATLSENADRLFAELGIPFKRG